MDISMTSLAPRAVADLRPAADAAATARIDAPPPTLAFGPVVPPASTLQGALVTRGLLDPQAVAPVRSPQAGEAPERVLKPWGVPMLPSEERQVPSDQCSAFPTGEGSRPAFGQPKGSVADRRSDPAADRPSNPAPGDSEPDDRLGRAPGGAKA